MHPVQTEDAHNFADMVARAVRVARQQKLAKPGERLVITAGVPFGTPGATNILGSPTSSQSRSTLLPLGNARPRSLGIAQL